MKKRFYLYSSIFLLTAFFGFEKANSYDFDNDFIVAPSLSREVQTTNDLSTEIGINSDNSNLAYSGTDELGAYWYGVGIGIAETLCYSTQEGFMSNTVSSNMMNDYRNIYRGGADFRSIQFEEGIQVALDSYPGCRF
tara:strand:+ start:67 stop:477 length:411 start_codon:yes stop_codon:yes gene_type:complete